MANNYRVNMTKFNKLKTLVDSKQLSVQDACKVLDISLHLWKKFSKEYDESKSEKEDTIINKKVV